MTAGNAQRSLGSALAVFAWALACSSFTSDDISHPGAADLQAAPVSGEERISGEEDHVALEGPTVGNAPREIDLGGLVARLRDTEALGFFTKLALKNEVDDLLDLVAVQQTGRPHKSRRYLSEFLEEGGFDVIHYHNISLLGGPTILEPILIPQFRAKS